MLNYFQRPVMADQAPDVVAAVATAINNGENNDFCKKPEDFEVWQIGEFDQESGLLVPKLTIITNCASLVRTGVREDTASARAKALAAAGRSQGAPGGTRGYQPAQDRPVQDAVHAANGDAQTPRGEPGGSHQVTHPHLRADDDGNELDI